MKNYLLLIICALALSACAANGPIARINAIRAEMLPKVNKQLVAQNLTPGTQAYIRVFKHERILEAWLYNNVTGTYQLYKTYPICAMSGGLGPKLREGDLQAPEGFYVISEARMWPGSQYHLAMNVGYPNAYDTSRGRTGSHIMIHGGCKSEGCFAMTDKAIEEIYLLVEQSLKHQMQPVPVHVFPFRMTPENMKANALSPWAPFWREIMPAYTAFESSKVPPVITLVNNNYRVKPQVYVSREKFVLF